MSYIQGHTDYVLGIDFCGVVHQGGSLWARTLGATCAVDGSLQWQLGRKTPEHRSRLQGPELLQWLSDLSLQIPFMFASFPHHRHQFHVDDVHQHSSNSWCHFLPHAIRQWEDLTTLLRHLTSWVTEEGPPCLPPPYLAFLGTLGRGDKGRSVVSLNSSFVQDLCPLFRTGLINLSIATLSDSSVTAGDADEVGVTSGEWATPKAAGRDIFHGLFLPVKVNYPSYRYKGSLSSRE